MLEGKEDAGWIVRRSEDFNIRKLRVFTVFKNGDSNTTNNGDNSDSTNDNNK